MSEAINDLVKNQLSVAVLNELGGVDAVISEFVKQVLSEKNYDSYGLKTDRYNDKKYTFLQSQMIKALRDAVHAIVTHQIGERRSQIEEAVKEELSKNVAPIAKLFIDGLMKSLDMNFNVIVKFTENTGVER